MSIQVWLVGSKVWSSSKTGGYGVFGVEPCELLEAHRNDLFEARQDALDVARTDVLVELLLHQCRRAETPEGVKRQRHVLLRLLLKTSPKLRKVEEMRDLELRDHVKAVDVQELVHAHSRRRP